MKKALIIITLLISSISNCASMPMAGPQQEASLTAPSLAPEPIAAPAPMAAPATLAPTAQTLTPPPAIVPATQAIPSALPSSQATITSVPVAQTQQTPGQQKTYEKEMSQIETSVQKIKVTKEATKQILKDLDTQITNAQQQIAQAKKISFDILRSGTPQEAQDQFNKIQKLLTEMQNIQNSIQIDTSKKFNDNLADIKVQIALIETLLNTLQTQGSFAKALPTATPTPIQKKPELEKPLATKIADMFANAFAYSIYGVKKAVNWVMEPPVEKEDKKKSPDATQPAPTINPAAPVAPPIADQAAKNTLTTQIILLTKMADSLEQIKIDFELKFNTINEAINALFTRLDNIAPIAQHLKEQNKNAGAQDMSGKEIILHVVSKTIDLTMISVAAAKGLIVKTYRKFFAPAVQTFTQDVSKKLETIDKEPDKSNKSTDIKEQK